MRLDEIAVLNAYNEVYQHGYGSVLITVAKGGESVDILPTKRKRLNLKNQTVEPKEKKT